MTHTFWWALGLAILVTILLRVVRYVIRCAIRRAAEDAHAHGYQLGVRDERFGMVRPSDAEATYPLIVETLPDGSKRRLDR